MIIYNLTKKRVSYSPIFKIKKTMWEDTGIRVAAVDLFCGVGGLTCGVQQAGIEVLAGYDIAEECRFAYEYNNDARFIYKDIKDIDDDEISTLYPEDVDIKVLMGCAPCQPFSAYSHRYKNSKNRKEKMELLDYFGKQVKLVQPDIVSMENVPQLAKEPIFERFVDLLHSEGYYVDWKVAYAPSYGIPQNRKRLLLLASKLNEIELIPETHTEENFPTVREAIGKLPKIAAGELYKKDPLHRAGSGRLPVNRTMKYLKILRATFHLMKSTFFAYSRDNFRAISWWIMF